MLISTEPDLPETAPLAFRAAPVDFCRIALYGILLVIVTRTRADPDLWGHLRFGLDILASGAIHATDPYSFTADRPWVNHEWLAELIMAIAYKPFGSSGLILLKLAAVLSVGSILWRAATRDGARGFVRDAFVVIALFATYIRLHVVRPQIFSVVLFCVMLHLLTRAAGSSRTGEASMTRDRTLWMVPLLFLAWANLHGAWIVGLAVLGTWCTGELLETRNYRRVYALAAVLLLSTAATLVNPYGTGLWQFLAETVRPERAEITDWKPLFELPPAVLAIEAILPVAGALALWKTRTRFRFPLRDVMVIAVLFAATVRVGRVDAFLQAAIAILLAPQLISLLNGIQPRVRASLVRKSTPVATLGAALGCYALFIGLTNVRALRVEGYWIPDRTAAVLLRESHPDTRILTWFDWGEYALWQLSPAGIRVSMDGRRETVYSARTIADHFRFYDGADDMIDYPDRIGADLVWLPSRMPVVERLARTGWRKILDTGQSVVLSRGGTPIPYRADAASGPDVFPWP